MLLFWNANRQPEEFLGIATTPATACRDLKTFISGPAYARRLTDAAAVATIRTDTMVTGWSDEENP